MQIIIVGGGPSGLLSSINIKKLHPDYEVTLIDKNNILGKKLRATGGGKSNIANIGDLNGKYFDQEAANNLFKEYSATYLINYFHSIGIETINLGDYVYPFSESSNAFTDLLIFIAKSNNVNFILDELAIDYKNNILTTNKRSYHFDKLIIASGLGSMPKLGADDTFVCNLSNHGYNVIKPVAGLTPIRTIENVKAIDGVRRKVNIKLIKNNKIIFNEDGELIFKKDGLGGIVTYHASSYIIHNKLDKAEIIVDFLPNKEFNGNLFSYFPQKFIKFISQYKNPKKVIFHVKNFYGFIDSVASIGGVSIDSVDENYKSKIEDNVYIIGEALNQDALCGGYNLMWAFSTALKCTDNI